MSNVTIIGTVSFWNAGGGYGFLDYSENGEIRSIYTHYTQLKNADRLRKYQIVQFVIGSNDRGQIAREVEVIEDAEIKKNSR